MAQIQMENLPRIFRAPARVPGLTGSPGAQLSFPLPVRKMVRPECGPLHPYARAAEIFITRALPFVFIVYYPTPRLLDKMNPPPRLGYRSPLAVLAVTAAAATVWSRCLVSNQGAGS